jgi:hypothetical protein
VRGGVRSTTTGWSGAPWSEQEEGGASLEGVTLFSARPSLLHRYLIVRHGNTGLELPYVFLDSGEEILPVLSSMEAAGRFLRSMGLGEGWYVREFSAGELV